MTDLERLVRDNPEQVAALSKDDPLRAVLSAEIRAGRVPAPMGLDDNSEALRDVEALRDALGQGVARDDAFQARLLAIAELSPRAPQRRAWLAIAVGSFAIAATVSLAWPRPAPVVVTADPAESAETQLAGHATATGQPSPEAGPELIAVRLWNRDCSSCKQLESKYKTVRADHEDDGRTLFVTFDFSTDKSSEQAHMLAKALGIGNIYDQHEGWSGMVLLIDPKSKSVIGKLSSSQSAADMHRGLVAALDR